MSVAAALLAAGLVAFVGCDDAPPVAPITPPAGAPAPLPVAIQWQHPLPTGNDLRRIWGFPDGTFYAVGDGGIVLRWDGSSVDAIEPPTREDLHGIWASSPSDLYVAGFNGTLLYFDGTVWQNIPTPTKDDYYAVWANATNDVFVAGTGGTVWNRMDDIWKTFDIAPDRRFRALWGYSHNEVYAAGSNGVLFRFDGTNWSRMIVAGLPNYDPEIRDLWGPSPGTISLVDLWNIVWFDGTTWRSRAVRDDTVFGLWGFDFNNQIAISAGSSTHVVGGTVQAYRTPTEEPLFDVWGTSMSNCYAVGRYGNIAHFDGAAWQAMNSGSVDDVRDIWVAPGEAVAVGDGGLVLRQNGTSWDEERVGTGYELSGVWSDGGTTVAVGRYTADGLDWREAVLVNNGTSWTDPGPVGNTYQLFDVWGSSADDVYAVGWAGEIIHYDGTSWSVALATNNIDEAALRSVSGTSASNVMAVGRTNDLKGLVFTFDGLNWTRTVLPDVEDLSGVWVAGTGSAFAVGSLGAIRQLQGSTWKPMSSPTSELLLGVWGTSSSDVYAVGWNGTLLHYEGGRWRILLPQTHRTLNALSGDTGHGVLLAGDKGTILRLDRDPDKLANIMD